MKQLGRLWTVISALIVFSIGAAVAADYPTPKEASWIVRDFRFHAGGLSRSLFRWSEKFR